MKEFVKKYYYYFIGGFILFFLVLINSVLAFSNNDKNEIEEEEIPQVKESVKTIFVDIKGEVKNPGVYEVGKDYTIYQAIEKAGGLTKEANTDYINLSKRVTDSMAIIIYSQKEINAMKKDEQIKYQIKVEEKSCPDNLNDACLNKKESSNKEENSSKVSLNEGVKEDFMTLSGVGESKAQAIVEYRLKNGPFKKIEDIKNVPGIGDSIYEKIKDNLTL